MLSRVLEPEVMDTAEEAADYDAMDHASVNQAFVLDLLALNADLSRTLDAGTGTALIAIELCERSRTAHVTAIDLATHMLSLAERNVRARGLEARITIAREDAKATTYSDARFTTVISNSLVHHVPEPGALFAEMLRVLAPGGLLFVRDLLRPVDADALDGLVETYAAIPSGLEAEARARHERQRALFAASLHAALSIDEVRAVAERVGVRGARVTQTSDRHFTLIARAPQ